MRRPTKSPSISGMFRSIWGRRRGDGGGSSVGEHHMDARLTVNDFDLLKVVGKGAFGKVGTRYLSFFFSSWGVRGSKELLLFFCLSWTCSFVFSPTTRGKKRTACQSSPRLDLKEITVEGWMAKGGSGKGGERSDEPKPSLPLVFPLQVMLVRKKTGTDTGQVYAMKVLKKSMIAAKGQVEHTKAERSILCEIHHPYIVCLRYAFQSEEKLYLITDYYSGGSLFYHLRKSRGFSEARAKFYAAELLAALEHLHDHHIIYRDLKLENVLMDHHGHIALTDFGLSKVRGRGGGRIRTRRGHERLEGHGWRRRA